MALYTAGLSLPRSYHDHVYLYLEIEGNPKSSTIIKLSEISDIIALFYELDPLKRAIISSVKELGEARGGDVVKRVKSLGFEVTRQRIYQLMNTLAERKILVKEGEGREAKYRLNEP